MRGSRGGTSGTDPPENKKKQLNIGFLSNTGPDPLKNHIPSQHSMSQWAIIDTPAKCHLNVVSLAGWWWRFGGIWITSSTKKKRSWTPLKKLFGSAHVAYGWINDNCNNISVIKDHFQEVNRVAKNELLPTLFGTRSFIVRQTSRW